MVGKMFIIFNNYTLVGKITVILVSFAKDTLVGSKTELIFTSFNKKTLVGKMDIIIIRFDTVSLVGKIAEIISSFDKNVLVGSKTEIIFISFKKRHLVGQNEINTVSYGNISLVDKMKIIFISSYKVSLVLKCIRQYSDNGSGNTSLVGNILWSRGGLAGRATGRSPSGPFQSLTFTVRMMLSLMSSYTVAQRGGPGEQVLRGLKGAQNYWKIMVLFVFFGKLHLKICLSLPSTL